MMFRPRIAQLFVATLATIPASTSNSAEEPGPPGQGVVAAEGEEYEGIPRRIAEGPAAVRRAFVAGVSDGYRDLPENSDAWYDAANEEIDRRERLGLDPPDVGALELKSAYREGWRAGLGHRRFEQYRGLKRRLADDYGGDWDKVATWEIGYRDGLESPEPKPGRETMRDPHRYLAYCDGFAVARRTRGEGREPIAIDPRPTHAREIAEYYVAQLDTLNTLAIQEYLLLDETTKDLKLLVTRDLPLDELIARTRTALERGEEANRIHLALQREAIVAARLRPMVIRALEGLAAEGIAAIQELEFVEFKGSLHATSDAIAAEARRLEEERIALPRDFGAMTRYQQEFLFTLTESLKAYELRSTLAGEGFDPDALLAAMDEYRRLAEAWQGDHLRAWRRDRLRRLYPEAYTPPDTIREHAIRGIERFLRAIPIDAD